MKNLKDFVVKFTKKPTKKGKYYFFNIPVQFIRSEIINPDLEYEIKIYSIKPNQKS